MVYVYEFRYFAAAGGTLLTVLAGAKTGTIVYYNNSNSNNVYTMKNTDCTCITSSPRRIIRVLSLLCIGMYTVYYHLQTNGFEDDNII